MGRAGPRAEKDTYLVLGITAHQPPGKGALLFHLQLGGNGDGPEAGLSSAPCFLQRSADRPRNSRTSEKNTWDYTTQVSEYF